MPSTQPPIVPIPLPIDPLLPEITALLRQNPALVLCAPPGAGKTTRVPPALLDAISPGQILVLEPRRIAAHLSAARVAEERGEELGQTVGVQMRYESVCGPGTRLRFVTEGVLLRRLLTDPHLGGVRAVLFDEFHERHLHADLALALLRRLQQGPRPDLRLCVMSATLLAGPVADFLGGCPVVHSEGRCHEVAIRYLPEVADPASGKPLEKQIQGALLRLFQEEAAQGTEVPGDVLVFLPGSAEIRRTRDALADLARERCLQLLPLHGELPLVEQRRAVAPRSAGQGRKIILSTNVAETSITIEGVTVVIDTGLARIAGHSPWSGLPTLKVQRICQASAAQRAGRAGRTRPGRCLRLYSQHDHDSRPRFEVPEIQRLDLAEALLFLRSAGIEVNGPQRLEWLLPPTEVALSGAQELLQRLGALDAGGAVTDLGRRMAQLPVHPRQARLVLAGQQLSVGEDAATLAALLGERDLRPGTLAQPGHRGQDDQSGPSDLLHLLDLFQLAQKLQFDRGRLQQHGIDPNAAMAVDRARRHLMQLLRQQRSAHVRTVPSPASGRGNEEGPEQSLLQAILAGYPDRVGQQRRTHEARAAATGDAEVVLSGGGTAVLSRRSVVRDAELLVVVDAEERDGGAGRGGRRAMVRLASEIKADWLLDLPGDRLNETTEVLWNATAERVEVVSRLQYEKLVLSESRSPGKGDDPAVSQALLVAARAAGPGAFADGDDLSRLKNRLHFARAHAGGDVFPALDEALLSLALADLCQGRASFAALRESSLLQTLRSRLRLDDPGRARRLSALAPEQVTLPGGRRVRVEYAPDQPPFIASRLQDFFGMSQGLTVAEGRVPLVLHLLAPSGRPVQVTTDLSGFWSRHYPAIRKELSRRYPRHSWPEDPLSASPPPPRKGRS